MTPVDHSHMDLARTAANVHGLECALVCAVVEQESNWDTWSVRYEPEFMTRYITPLLDAGTVKTMTEAMERATSFGLMQVMGQVARENGFAGRWLTQLCDPAIGLDIGCKVLRAKLDRAGGDVHTALLHWNGGADPAYPAEVLARLSKYTEEIQT
jgi:soluble lytic murein transglycosylase-like protein